jgi:hypothetical protein
MNTLAVLVSGLSLTGAVLIKGPILAPSLSMGDLHLPIASQSGAFKAIRKESLDAFNRLHSIDEDASFVSSIAHAYPSLPVVGMLADAV